MLKIISINEKKICDKALNYFKLGNVSQEIIDYLLIKLLAGQLSKKDTRENINNQLNMRKIYNYGQIIRAKRQNKNIKAITLAKELGITPAYLSLIESNQRSKVEHVSEQASRSESSQAGAPLIQKQEENR